MIYFIDFLISFIQSFIMMQILVTLIQKSVPIRFTLYLAIGSFLLYYLMSSFFFLYIVAFSWWIIKKIDFSIPTLLCWFYSVYCTFFYALFGYIATILFIGLLGSSYSEYELILNLTIIPLMPLLISKVYAYFLRPPLAFLRQNYDYLHRGFLIIINTVLTVCCIIQYTGYWIENNIFPSGIPFRDNMLLIFTSIMFSILLYFAYKAKNLNQQQIQDLKEQQLADITDYAVQIETMYQELRGFRHDFQNVLISMGESIKSRDVKIIEANYRETLEKYGIDLNETYSVLPRLQGIMDLPIKGLLSAKVIFAEKNGLLVTLEVEENIVSSHNDLVVLLRVLSILLDNAIEAALESQQKYFGISIMNEDGETILIIIENSYNERPPITEIFKPAFSTKGSGRGQGLCIVQQILDHNHNLSLQTKVEANLFSQLFRIKGGIG